jgi:hypothetical protein
MAANNANLYEVFGGRTACRELSVAFYARVARDPVLRPLFPGKSFRCAIEEFSAFLAQLLGGPGADSQRRWWLSTGPPSSLPPVGVVRFLVSDMVFMGWSRQSRRKRAKNFITFAAMRQMQTLSFREVSS